MKLLTQGKLEKKIVEEEIPFDEQVSKLCDLVIDMHEVYRHPEKEILYFSKNKPVYEKCSNILKI